MSTSTPRVILGLSYLQLDIYRGSIKTKVKSRLNHDEAQMHFLTNVPSKWELPTPCGFQDMAQTRFIKVKVITARSNQGQTMTLNNNTPYLMSLPSINFLHLMVF